VAAAAVAGKRFDPFSAGGLGPGGRWILDQTELHPGAQVLVPDLAVWRRERMPALPHAARLEVAPVRVGEVLSASAAKTDRTPKMPIHAGHGVLPLWLVDPVLRTLEACRL
jgi:Uma2 family endonuclease